MKFLNNLLEINEYNNVSISGLTTQLIPFCLEKIQQLSKKDILIVTNSLYEANVLFSSMIKVDKNTLLFPMDDFLTSEALASSPELKASRINTLESLSINNFDQGRIVITNLMGFLRFLPSKEIWKKNNIKIRKNIEISKEFLYEKLINMGYESESLVTKTGEIANRGYIIDVFPIALDKPIRIEFWGDEIESIRYFDVDSQRSLEEIDEFVISPFSEFIIEKDIEGIEHKQEYLPLVMEKISNLKSYLDNPIIVYKDYNQLVNSYKKLQEEIYDYCNTKSEKKDIKYMFEFQELEQKKYNIYLLTIDNIINNVEINKKYIFDAKLSNKFNSNIDLLNSFIEKSLYQNKTVIIALKSNEKIKGLKKYLTVPSLITGVSNINENSLNLIEYDLTEGFEINNYIVLTEKELFKQNIDKSNYKNKFKIGTKIKNINNLNIGDYVVHINHGVGIYCGIKTLNKNGLKKDYIEVKYKDKDKLYIPVEKIDLISKYSSKEGFSPKLNKLGGTEWAKTKLRVKNKVKDIAATLIKISAERKMKKGFAFSKDDELQKEFESEFVYTPTKDQFIAIEKIKNDMEKPYPMDMLLCGDVGYGKTEVAFRAIFKAIDNNKQVAYLCPTTILSSQQYKNAKDRFSNFGVNIALLNRFVSKKESNEIKEKLKSGKIDLLIGTHRLLSKDVQFKDLGLLVIDEEQRFGVTHKEKIKEYKSNVDVLTLSATPIPRTLQMSLVGIRNLALIETPPIDRYPIQTYVIEESDQLIREAIYKEMSRNGQIFILFNSVENIENKMYVIQNLVPEAKIKIAHGKMTKNQIEDTMMSFINNEFDILLCTTIIETGIDIPNVNTLIIYDADRFGLSQLYQIRGRVGRSNKIAYAYLMYKRNKVLNEIAIKRLNAIKEFTQLGSGFQIAMRDLSIRGAGDILGSEQAGFIDTVGYDLYIRILNDEVNRLKGIKPKEEIKEEEKPFIDVSTHIDDNYINDEDLKIELHKKISEIHDKNSLNEVKTEIEDRFGKIDEELEIYMYEQWFEKLAKSNHVIKVDETKLYVEIFFDKEFTKDLDVKKLFMLANEISLNFNFNYSSEILSIKLLLNNLEKHYIYYLVELLSKYSNINV